MLDLCTAVKGKAVKNKRNNEFLILFMILQFRALEKWYVKNKYRVMFFLHWFATGRSGFNSRQEQNNFSPAWVLCIGHLFTGLITWADLWSVTKICQWKKHAAPSSGLSECMKFGREDAARRNRRPEKNGQQTERPWKTMIVTCSFSVIIYNSNNNNVWKNCYC